MRHLLTAVFAALCLFTASACNLQTSAPTPPPTPDAPQVEFLAPANGEQIPENVELDIDLLARDAGSGVARVELMINDLPYKDARPVSGEAVPVFTVKMNWLAQGAGLHSLAAVAYRADGTAGPPALVIIEVVTSQ